MDDVTTELERTLSEIVDLVLETKQARWKMPPSDPLRRSLEALAGDCAEWAGRLAELVLSHGGSLTGDLGTVAGRQPGDLFPAAVDHATLVAFFEEHLAAEAARVRDHRQAAEADVAVCELLDAVAAGLERHRTALAELA